MDNLNVSGVYKIVNEVTGDSYIGSSRNIQARWYTHRAPSAWRKYPNRALYQDMQKYGVENFRLQLLAPVMPEYLRQVEQELIDMLNPSYNDRNSSGLNVERYKKAVSKGIKKYQQSEKGKESLKKSRDKYFHTEKGKKALRKYQKKYYSQLCEYNGETLTLKALISHFSKEGIVHPTQEARKYLKK